MHTKSGCLDIVLTGNFFIPEREMRELVVAECAHISFSRKGSATSEPLRDALSQYYNLPSGAFSIGVGSSQIIDAILQFYRTLQVVDVIPNFAMAARTCKRTGIEYLQLKVCSPAELLPAAAALPPRQDRLFILSSPRNPYGYSFSIEQIRKLLEINQGPVLVDEAYVEYSNVNLLSLLGEYKNLILIRTFSKAWGIGNLRVGYAISNILPQSFQRESLLPYNVGELSQRVVCALLRNPAMVHSSVRQTIEARARLLHQMRRVKQFSVWNSDANFICVEYPRADELIRFLETRRIKISALHGVRHYPDEWPQGFRLCVLPADIQDRLVAHIEEFMSSPQQIDPRTVAATSESIKLGQ